MYYQQKLGPRFFIPYKYRRNPNAYNYFFKFSSRTTNDPERSEYSTEEHVECVICMNKIIYEIDEDSNLVGEKQIEMVS